MNDPIQQFTGDTQIAKLLRELEELFPVVNPQPTDDFSLIMYRSGQRAVVEYIQSLIENNDV